MTLFISAIYVPLSGVRVFSGAGVDIFPSLPCVGKPPMVVVTVQGALLLSTTRANCMWAVAIVLIMLSQAPSTHMDIFMRVSYLPCLLQ
jgi:hypothetical protein